jgi:hypothetical protein
LFRGRQRGGHPGGSGSDHDDVVRAEQGQFGRVGGAREAGREGEPARRRGAEHPTPRRAGL